LGGCCIISQQVVTVEASLSLGMVGGDRTYCRDLVFMLELQPSAELGGWGGGGEPCQPQLMGDFVMGVVCMVA
jgi:hypothetical protein